MILTGQAKLAGVIGWPVGHSRSPRLHGWWLDHYGIDGAYLPLAVAPEQFAQVLRTLPLMGFRGANITVPHKQAALAAVDLADDHAKRIGAVNTVIVRDDGALEGKNTDGLGFFALPTLVVKEAVACYGFQIIGRTKDCRQQFYAISAERNLTHPAVLAITSQARAAFSD